MVVNDSLDTLPVIVVALTRSVMRTTLFGSAPLSPEALEVEVVAHSVTVPSSFTTPARLRSPIVVTAVAGANVTSVVDRRTLSGHHYTSVSRIFGGRMGEAGWRDARGA